MTSWTLDHTMFRILPLFLLLVASCSEQSTLEQVRQQAAHSDVVWLCDADTNGPAVRFRTKQSLMTNATIGKFTSGQFLPVSGPEVESGTRYGEEAVVFFSSHSATSRISTDFILLFHGGKTGDGTSRDAVIDLIQEEHGRLDRK
jgi:hypothetical protein